MNVNSELEVSIVLPCLNEELTIGKCIQEIKAFFDFTDINYEILVGNNNSTDSSKNISISLGAKVIDILEPGYGITLRKTTELAKGRYIIMGDSDLSYDFSNLMPFIDELRAGTKLVIGNRFKGGIEKGAMPWKNKYIGNPALSKLGKLFFRIKINDFHCGLRGFSKEAFNRWNLQSNGMEYASEMVIKAALNGDSLSEIPITLRKDGRKGRSPHLRPWRDGFRHLSFMLLHSPKWLFLYPGFLLFLTSITFSLLLFYKPIIFGTVKFDTNSLITSCFMILLSFQLFLFGIISEILAINLFKLKNNSFVNFFIKNLSIKIILIISLILIILGVIGFIFCLYLWGLTNFGNLITNQVFKYLILSLTILLLGFQVLFNTLFVIFLRFDCLNRS